MSFFPDILLNFRTTYVSRKGEVVSDWRAISVNYLRGWFVVDLLAALPFDHLYASDLYSGEVSFSVILTLLFFLGNQLSSAEYDLNEFALFIRTLHFGLIDSPLLCHRTGITYTFG